MGIVLTYSKLYSQFADETRHIKRTEFRDAACQLTGVNKVIHSCSGMDISICRGIFIKYPANAKHPLFKSLDGDVVIITARELNRCWDRFVYCKELMHVFSSGDDCASTPEEFAALLNDLTSPSGSPSQQFRDEQECFWRALALICPKARRDAFMKRLSAGEITEYDIAVELRIPELYVSRLFEPGYDQFLKGQGLI